MATGHQRLRQMMRSCKVLTAAALLPTVLAVQMLAGAATARDSDNLQLPPLAPLINANSPKRIPGEYIVVFREESEERVFAPAAEKTVLEKVRRLGGTILQTYTMAPRGFSAKLSESALQVLRADPSVDYIEVNQTGWYNTVQCGTPPCDLLSNPPTGLDRTSERGIPPEPRLDGRYSYSEQGTGVHVYVIDSGIDHTHTEFRGRVAPGKKIEPNTPSTASPDNDLTATDDCNGHGTHVAGIIGGMNVGTAKQATLHPVRANVGCSAVTLDRVIKAVEWVTAEVARQRSGPSPQPYPAVANLSVSFWTEPLDRRNALKDAVIASIDSGLPHVIAAGNNNTDACISPESTNYRESPAIVNLGAPNRAIVVGAVNPDNDTRWHQAPLIGSNTGACLSLFAPGVDILSAKSNQVSRGNMTEQRSGTSQATAHVTGVVARILGISGNGNLIPAEVWEKVRYASNRYGTTAGWGGVFTVRKKADGTDEIVPITDVSPNSPNEMLHYGSYNNGRDDRDSLSPAVPTNLRVQ